MAKNNPHTIPYLENSRICKNRQFYWPSGSNGSSRYSEFSRYSRSSGSVGLVGIAGLVGLVGLELGQRHMIGENANERKGKKRKLFHRPLHRATHYVTYFCEGVPNSKQFRNSRHFLTVFETNYLRHLRKNCIDLVRVNGTI